MRMSYAALNAAMACLKAELPTVSLKTHLIASKHFCERIKTDRCADGCGSVPVIWTRQQLKGLRLLLDSAGYSETTLRSAWRDATNEDIAASIIGFIRQAALEMPWSLWRTS